MGPHSGLNVQQGLSMTGTYSSLINERRLGGLKTSDQAHRLQVAGAGHDH